jgi:hypothetical protein
MLSAGGTMRGRFALMSPFSYFARMLVRKSLRLKSCGSKRSRAVDALVVLEGRLLLELLLAPQSIDAHGEDLRNDHLVEVHRAARAPVGTDTRLGAADRAELRVARGGVDDAGGTAETEEDRVGPTLDVDAIDIVVVPRNVGDEEVAGVVRRGQTTHAVGTTGGAQGAGFIDARAVAQTGVGAAGAGHLGVGRVLEQGGGVRRADVLHEFLGDDGDRRADVAQVRADARAGQRLGRLVTGVARGRDFEGRQLDDFFGVGSSAGFGLGRGRGRRSGLGRERPGAGERRDGRDQGYTGFHGWLGKERAAVCRRRGRAKRELCRG